MIEKPTKKGPLTAGQDSTPSSRPARNGGTFTGLYAEQPPDSLDFFTDRLKKIRLSSSLRCNILNP